MPENKLMSLDQVNNFKVSEDRVLFSATHEEILNGATTDIYFVKTHEILKNMGKDDIEVVAEVFARKSGVFCGLPEAMSLLKDSDVEIWALPEGETFERKEVLMRIKGSYGEFGLFETPLLGILASSSGWATAAREIKEVSGDKMSLVFGARHVHPAIAPVMERSALVGGVDGASCILGAKLGGKEPKGTVPHAIFLIVGDTVEVAKAYDDLMPEGEPRLVLVDTFKDEAEESLRVAEALGKRLNGIRLDTPSERGGVTPALVREIRARLDLAGFEHVQIFASGGLTPDRIKDLKEAGVESFGVGSYISGARAIDMTMDLKEIGGKSIAKRGRIPGITPTDRLVKLK
ncbi:nicotinate phosphoribosyltransferase [Desulfonispora thiosulfatigenes DSM 11270]|uniref:Nicotinate phosphoribosyltransferase n=1 Tax=Desulfonispora thiosulfatigenes DSM 11270 TaxID=656914 RepID=A0A1W1VJ36_DESTI|nr:nicotinate phosphoribosyltransferase [Desulfonispora thiosulfatigenes]SMB92944.1 nicotinate phosphoribosyltransferase [Desulfonispora thiosulfatigenes DSM 11270]